MVNPVAQRPALQGAADDVLDVGAPRRPRPPGPISVKFANRPCSSSPCRSLMCAAWPSPVKKLSGRTGSQRPRCSRLRTHAAARAGASSSTRVCTSSRREARRHASRAGVTGSEDGLGPHEFRHPARQRRRRHKGTPRRGPVRGSGARASRPSAAPPADPRTRRGPARRPASGPTRTRGRAARGPARSPGGRDPGRTSIATPTRTTSGPATVTPARTSTFRTRLRPDQASMRSRRLRARGDRWGCVIKVLVRSEANASG